MNAPPILLVVFNRPEVSRQLVDALRSVRPRDLFVAGDGPRAGHPTDTARVAQTRRIIDEIDWDCRVRTRYQPRNIGLQAAMIGAIDWFFGYVDAGIILEDDCIPAPAFFPFVGEMLDRYANHSEVMHVSGLNMDPDRRVSSRSYWFTEVGHIWGWATWRRAWQRFDRNLSNWPESRHRYVRGAPPLHRVLARKFDSAHARRKYTWSRAWYWTTMSNQGLAIIPAANLVENIGDGPDATHGATPHHPLRRPVRGGLHFPLNHPERLSPNLAYTRLLVRYHRGSYRRRVEDLVWSLTRSGSVRR